MVGKIMPYISQIENFYSRDWNIVESDIDHLHTCLNAEESKIKTAEILQK